MTKANILIGIIGGIVTILVGTFPILQYFFRLDNRIGQLEEQVRYLTPTTMMVDRLSSRVGQLEEQMRSVTVLPNSMSEANVRLDGHFNQIQEKVRSLAASLAATAATVNELSKKPMVQVNPVLAKCAELAD